MNVSHAWLARFVPHGRSPEAIRDLLTAHVATVEGLESLRPDLVRFVVGQVVASEKIPETKLSYNKVDDGSGTLLEVVCGAPNVTVGAKYPFARTGTTMPGGLVIEKRKIRGFTSNGMLCSARELGLGEDHDGILTLETAAAPGTPFLDVFPTGDVRIVVDVLPNRPDLLSHRGVAREVAALTGVALQMPEEIAALPALDHAVVRGGPEGAAGGITVRIADRADCPQYAAAVIEGVTVGPSPAWLRAAVEAVGGRSINNIVDATNYLLHGFGQPVHAFDAARLGGATLEVRRARAGETLVTLDGAARTLTPQMLVIADGSAPTALAGGLGGQGSEVTDATTRVALEVAEFAPAVVRATRRAVGLSTDASYRFERGVDGGALEELLRIGAALLAQVGGGRVTGLVHIGEAPEARPAVTVRPERVAAVLGDAVPAAEIASWLTNVGCAVRAEASGPLTVVPPSWRHDIQREVDCIEEVARLRGFDRLPDALQGARPGTVPDHPLWIASRRLRDALIAEGVHEVRPLPFVRGEDATHVRVRNPLAEDEPHLRRSLLESLARRAEYNLTRMQGDVRLFEVGAVFRPAAEALPHEEYRVAALVMGARRPVHFSEPQPPAYDAWDAKALGERMAAIAYPGAVIALQAPAPADGALWEITADGCAVGVIRPLALDAPVWAKPAFGIELVLGAMPSAPVAPPRSHAHGTAAARERQAPVRFRPLPTTPAAEFDLALLVPDAVEAAAVEGVLREAGGALLERCVLFDEFRGTGVAEGFRSLAWRLTFRHPERTLKEKEIEGRRQQLLSAVETRLDVRPRVA
ncbi:MAG: phenylalanine--tRNA ligase subunit beta [Gemmatimonadaceae bacterium]